MMKKQFFFFLTFASIAVAEEVSVFGAGDLNSKNPYGLNTTEKHILMNKKNIKNMDNSFKDLKTNVSSLKQRIEAIESIYEGDSKKLNSSVLKLNNLVNNIENNKNSSVKQQSSIEELRVVSEQLALVQEETNKNVENLKDALLKLSKLVNKINSSYISDKEFKSNMNQFITREEFESLKKALGVSTKKKNNSNSSNSEVSNENLSSSQKQEILDEAIALYNKKYFKYAIPKFENLIALNYKPAQSNFYLGQMWYVRKKYDLAISHYKKSAILYDKAAYMPTLLLHSAISFEKTGDNENARSFYSTLIDLYPDSKESKVAKDNLTNLN